MNTISKMLWNVGYALLPFTHSSIVPVGMMIRRVDRYTPTQTKDKSINQKHTQIFRINRTFIVSGIAVERHR
jgi:hypothetical protein